MTSRYGVWFAVTIVLLCTGVIGVDGCSNNYGMSLHGCPNFYDIRTNCTGVVTKYRGPCLRVCHPEDCLISTSLDREDLQNGSRRGGVIAYKVYCVVEMAKQSQRKGCYDADLFTNVTRDLLEKFVYKYNVTTLTSGYRNPVFEIGRTGGVVIPTALNHHKFSLCIKFTLTQHPDDEQGTELVSFNVTWGYTANNVNTKFFRIAVYRKYFLFQSYQSGMSVFLSPFTILPGSDIALCLSYRSSPEVKISAWVRKEGELLTRMEPTYYMPFPNTRSLNVDHLIGVLSLGNAPQFVGVVHSFSVVGRFLTTKRQVLPFLRCEENLMDELRSLVAGALGMAGWVTHEDVKVWTNGTELRGDVAVRGATEGDRERYCGDCASCKQRCMQANMNCSFIKSCASCEELSCPSSTHYQKTYKDTCLTLNDTTLSSCNTSALRNCFVRRTKRCRDLHNTVNCLNKIDLESCSYDMFVDANLDTVQFVKCDIEKFLLLDLMVAPRMSECGQACVVSSGLRELDVTFFPSRDRNLRMKDNRRLCASVSRYRRCTVENECPERITHDSDYTPDHSNYAWLYSLVERLYRIKESGCLLGPECMEVLNSTEGQSAMDAVKYFDSRDPLPRGGNKLHAVNNYHRLIPLPTRKEIGHCKKRAQGKANATLILTPKQLQSNRRHKRLSGPDFENADAEEDAGAEDAEIGMHDSDVWNVVRFLNGTALEVLPSYWDFMR